MSLDDLVPDDKQSSSRSRSRTRTQEEKEEQIEIGSEPYKKTFEEDYWERIKDTLIHDMGHVPNEVVNNYQAEKRYEVLHEAALLTPTDEDDEVVDKDELEHVHQECDICGNAAGEAGCEIEGFWVCFHHPIAKLQRLIEEEQDD